MKKYLIYIVGLALTVPSVTSCEDMGLLEEHPKKVMAENFMTNAETVESEVNAIYFQLRSTAVFGRYLSVLSETLSDYCYGRNTYASSYSTGLTTSGRSFARDTWGTIYRGIRFANNLLVNIKSVGLSEKDYELYTGEIRYLRALSYSYLLRYYGGVPFYDENNMDNFSKPRTPEKTLWEFVLSEGKYAESVLPAVPREAGRPSKYAALMLQTEAALYLEDYAEAATASGKIIDSGVFSLVKTTQPDDFENLYGYQTIKSSEEIFYIKYNRENGNTFEWMYLCKPNPIANTGALGIYTDVKNNNVIAEWDTRDLRYQYSLARSSNGTLKTLTGSNGRICVKYRDYETDLHTMATDWPVYRYADALLYYAEAVCRRDGAPDAKAMEMINKVHRRAYGHDPETPHTSDYKLSDYNTSDKFIELLLKEKCYEQCFEGKRYCDLKRQGKLAEYALKAGRVKSLDEVKDAAYWWPIPEEEFNYNDSLDPTTDQNPGY